MVSLRSEALRPMDPAQQAGSPYSLGQWLASAGRETTTGHIELEPLGERETVQMILSILSPPAADFARWLYNETRGQPFYLIETLKDLLERRVLHAKWHSGGRWTFAVDADHNLGQTVRVPSTIHAVIRSRLHRLSPRASSLLAGAAVLDWQITFKRLCAISNTSEDKVLPALDELISGRLLLEAAQPSKISAYTFTNDMLRVSCRLSFFYRFRYCGDPVSLVCWWHERAPAQGDRIWGFADPVRCDDARAPRPFRRGRGTAPRTVRWWAARAPCRACSPPGR